MNMQPGPHAERARAIQLRQLDATRCELVSMASELHCYPSEFTRKQRVAMRKAMEALSLLIDTLEA